jgi:hypothetical protein
MLLDFEDFVIPIASHARRNCVKRNYAERTTSIRTAIKKTYSPAVHQRMSWEFPATAQ